MNQTVTEPADPVQFTTQQVNEALHLWARTTLLLAQYVREYHDETLVRDVHSLTTDVNKWREDVLRTQAYNNTSS